MSIYGNLSKPQRQLLFRLLQQTAVSIDTAVKAGVWRVAPCVRLRELGLIEFQRSMVWGPCTGRCYAWLTADGLRLVQSVRANADTSRYRRFRDASHN